MGYGRMGYGVGSGHGFRRKKDKDKDKEKDKDKDKKKDKKKDKSKDKDKDKTKDNNKKKKTTSTPTATPTKATFDDIDIESGEAGPLEERRNVSGNSFKIVPDPDFDIQVPVQEDVIISKREKCRNCCLKFIAFLFSTIGLSCLLVGYTILGGLIFMKLEAEKEMELKGNVKEMRMEHADMLWNITEELNVLHQQNWTDMANQVLFDYTQKVYLATKIDGWDGKEIEGDEDPTIQWTFAGAMLYSITVITTIGYGHIAPKTDWGRVVTIAYAIVGIPLTLLTLTNLGGFMATAFRFLYKNVCCGLCCICCERRERRRGTITSAVKFKEAENGDPGASHSLTDPTESPTYKPKKYSIKVTWRKGIARMMKTEDNKRVTVPIYISLMLISGYIAIGALLFTLWEDDWDYLIGSYFCFITLTTIGFGDYVPGTSVDSWAAQEKLILCCMYLLFGLALIAMSFDLMQEEVRNKCTNLAMKLGLVQKKS